MHYKKHQKYPYCGEEQLTILKGDISTTDNKSNVLDTTFCKLYKSVEKKTISSTFFATSITFDGTKSKVSLSAT